MIDNLDKNKANAISIIASILDPIGSVYVMIYRNILIVSERIVIDIPIIVEQL